MYSSSLYNNDRNVWDIYDQWVRANEKARAYILASISDVLNKKHEVMPTAREIMALLQEMFGKPSSSIRHEAIKYVDSTRMKDWSNIREHVLDMMVHFNIAEAHGAMIDEISQMSGNATTTGGLLDKKYDEAKNILDRISKNHEDWRESDQ
ncbi:uncharacterized protein LOC120089124 [Benincasa hispida]|uniref:uncharacterized protein LOC120089124 n=1 Tax=Benincasa hispida TaxID=102211 RepID=UPI001900EDF7|nr:uncharacterized protein LOC120089124 [Benincasa hispida]